MNGPRTCPNCGAQLLERDRCRVCPWVAKAPPKPASTAYRKLPPLTPEQRERNKRFAEEFKALAEKLCGPDHRKGRTQ